MEDLRAMSAGLCTELEQNDCIKELDGNRESLKWACEKCKKAKLEDLHDYTVGLFQLRTLKLAGYPFAKNDLTTEEWLDLGVIEKWQHEPHR